MSVSGPDQRLRVAMIVADEREVHARYELPKPYFGSAPAALLSGFLQLDGIDIHIVSCVRQPLLAPRMLGPNVYYHAVPVPKWGYLKTGYFPAILRIRRTLEMIEPDVAHGQGTERYYALAAAFSGYPSVITIHGNMRAVARALHARPFSFHWITARLETLALKRAAGVICLSSYTHRQVAGLARKHWIVHNPVPDVFFGIAAARRVPARLICVGLICSYKNQNALIRALDHLAGRYQFTLAFAGPFMPGKYEQEFRELISRRSWCEYLGVLDEGELRKELSIATCLVHPSLEDNCPMVILEAMAAGLPVVASRCGGIPDIVDPGKTGYICDTHDMQTFGNAIESILKDPILYKELGSSGRARANREFRPMHIAAQHLSIYQELLEFRKSA